MVPLWEVRLYQPMSSMGPMSSMDPMQGMLSHDLPAVLRKVTLFAAMAWMKEMGRKRRVHVLAEAVPKKLVSRVVLHLANVVQVQSSHLSCTSR